MSTGSRDPFALKFKGSNKAFAPFASVGEGAAVARLWLCAAPVASHLEAGERVANLAWRLWAIHERTVVDESPRHRRSFKRLAKGVGERLDRDRSRPVHELSSPELPPVSSSGPDPTERLTRRVELKTRTRQRTHLAGGSAMHTFLLDPTIGLDRSASSSTTTAAVSRRGSNVSSAGVGRPALTSSDQGSGGSASGRSTGISGSGLDVEMTGAGRLNLTYPPLGHLDGQQDGSLGGPPMLQRAPSIPSSLRMTPNSSRRSSFARSAVHQQQQTVDDKANLPPPYPSSHPFARSQSGSAADVLGGQLLGQFQSHAGQMTGQASFGTAGQQSCQTDLGQQQQQQQQQQLDHQQAVAATLNHLWGQLGTSSSNLSANDMQSLSGPGGAHSFRALGTHQQQPVGSTPASSSDASSPDHLFSPAAGSGSAGFHFAQRVTGMQGQQPLHQAMSTGSGGGSGTPLGPHRRSSNSEGIGLHGAQPYRRPSLSQQASALPSGAGSPAGVSRRTSFAQRRRESMSLNASGTVTPAEGSTPNLSLSAVNPGWMTPTGDLAASLLGVELASPLDEPGPRPLRRSSTLAAASPKQLKHRTFSSGSGGGSGGGLYARSGLLSGLTLSNDAAQTPSNSVFFDDVPMEDAGGQLERQQRRMSDSSLAGRAASSHSLRDQLREMQLQHQSYQQAAGYASTLESYVPPPAAPTSSPAAGAFGALPPSSTRSLSVSTSDSNGNEAVFPSLGGLATGHPPAIASLFDVNAHPTANVSLEPSPSFAPAATSEDPSDFLFAPTPNLDDISSLFSTFLDGGGSALNPVTEAEHDP